MSYFEEDEVIQDKVKIRFEDYTGHILESWIVLEKIKPIGYHYKVRCKCEREFVRNIATILNGRSSQCYLCSKKHRWFYRR